MDDLINFYRDVSKIKHIERKGWSRINLRGIKDTIASHSYGAALLAWILAKRENVDENKLIKLMLVHDLIMAHVEDFTPEDSEYISKKEIENKAASNLFDNLPEEIAEEFKSLFNEYQEEKTEESLLARECDKLDTLFQALIYSERSNKDELSRFISTYKDKFRSQTGKKILRDLESIEFEDRQG